jgi:hypothetical protein
MINASGVKLRTHDKQQNKKQSKTTLMTLLTTTRKYRFFDHGLSEPGQSKSRLFLPSEQIEQRGL